MKVLINIFSNKVTRINNDIECIGKVSNIVDVIEHLKNITDINEWGEILAKFIGFYAIIKKNDNGVFASVDHTRSIPLFYAVNGDEFYLSDQAEWVRQKVSDHEIDRVAKEEFQMLGYVLGDKTLYPSVKQLQAGESLALVNGKLLKNRYFNFKHIEPEKFNKNIFMSELNIVAEKSIQRLISYANGRQIVVPLSGGYDSRLIVSLLRKLNYNNVICFSYGVPGNKESNYSRKISEALEYKWLFVEYTENIWKEAWASKEAIEFRVSSSNHSSLPHVQDWLAVSKLKSNSDIEFDAVFVPGHCCVTGYIPDDIFSKKFSPSIYYDAVINTHFKGRPFILNEILSIRGIEEFLMENKEINNVYDVASEIMSFNWQERQAKYITNSVRVYENNGFDWWLPLWDQDFMSLWEKVPLRDRINRSLYIDYVNSVFSDAKKDGDIGLIDNASDRLTIYKYLKSVLRKVSPDFFYDFVKNKHKKTIYKNHYLKFESLFPSDDFDFYLDSGYSIIGIYSDLFLKGKWGIE